MLIMPDHKCVYCNKTASLAQAGSPCPKAKFHVIIREGRCSYCGTITPNHTAPCSKSPTKFHSKSGSL